ncbi:hypothetical protein BC826DRAFT_1061614 [Russula brevipes]|nr:hypothetical protein BC826DRAFT_1061614 [Russula brevipes]
MGWRYLVSTLKDLMLLMTSLPRFTFLLYESLRYLLGRRHDKVAMAVVSQIARNGN